MRLQLLSAAVDGVDTNILRHLGADDAFVSSVLSSLEPHVLEGRVWLAKGADRFGLTDPEGCLLSNTVLADIFEAVDTD